METETTKEYRYYAFISYSRANEKEARWLQKKLESYRLSSVFKKRHENLPKRMKIFLDKTDIGGGGAVENALLNELKESKNLIVICSPESTKSEYVEYEIESFIKLRGNANNIFPFAIRGNPKEGADDDCFAPILHKNNLTAIEIKEFGKENAFIRLISKLLEINYDDLKQREQRWTIRRISIILAVLGALIAASTVFIPAELRISFFNTITAYIVAGTFAVFAAALLFWNEKLRTTFEYYADYVDKWGMPTGIHPMKKSLVKHRKQHYRFEYRNGKLRRVVFANSVGQPMEQEETEFTDRPIIQKMNYNEKGKLRSIYSNDKSGRTLFEIDFGKDYCRANLRGRWCDSRSLGVYMFSMYGKNLGKINADLAITSYSYKRNADGYVIEQTFSKYHDADVPSKNLEGFLGYEYVLKGNGQIKQLWYLDGSKKRACTVQGIAGRQYEYNERGDICKITYIDENGKPILNENYWATKKYEQDKWGNIIKISFYGINGEPVMAKEGYAILEYKYDEKGQKIEESYCDLNGTPILNCDGYASKKYKYNNRGNIVEESYYDIDGKITLTNGGFAFVKWNYRKNILMRTLEKSYCGFDGKPVLNTEGYAFVKWYYRNYQLFGMNIEQDYYDINGKLAICKDGYSIIKLDYDELDNKVNQVFSKEEKILDFKWLVKTMFSRRKREEFIADYLKGANRVESLINSGTSLAKSKYDENGQLVEEYHIDAEGKPVQIGQNYEK